MLWVGIAIVGMFFITLLLSQYNMRWIARRAAARPEVSAQPADAGPVQAPPPVPTPVGGAPRVLILFSDTGGGHRAAARALTDALKLFDPTCVVTVADPLMAQGPWRS